MCGLFSCFYSCFKFAFLICSMPVIESVSFGEVRIGGRTYYSDVIVYWDGQFELKAKLHLLDVQEFADIIKRRVEAVVVGTGIQGSLRLTDGVRALAQQKKIRLFVERSTEAADVFNGLVASGKKVAAFIHTTG